MAEYFVKYATAPEEGAKVLFGCIKYAHILQVEVANLFVLLEHAYVGVGDLQLLFACNKLLHTIYSCGFILMSTYYENFSDLQHAGYLTMLLANMIVIITGFLSIHFLTQKPANMKISYCIFIHVAMIFAMLLGISTIALMLTSPTPAEILAYTRRYVRIYHRAPFMVRGVFTEKKCCGIQNFGDVFKNVSHPSRNATAIKARNGMILMVGPEEIYFRIPPSCCRRGKNSRKRCQLWTDDKLISPEDFEKLKFQYLNQEPCLKKGETFSEFRNTNTYRIYLIPVYCTSGLFVFILGILLVLNYYIWYRFPRMPVGDRPDRFNENLRSLVKCHYRKLRKSLEENKKRKSADQEAMLEAKNDGKPSEFAMRHQLIMQSLATMRAQTKEMRLKEQKERQLDAAKSRSNMFLRSLSNSRLPSSKRPSQTNFLTVDDNR